MLEFGYCLWLSPETDSELYTFFTDFSPHISLAIKEDYNSCLLKYKLIDKQSFLIKILEDPIITVDEDFNALQFNVELVNKNLSLPLNPQNPHISFVYRYNHSITKEEVLKIKNQINFDKVYIFDKYKLMCCNGHFKDWYVVNN